MNSPSIIDAATGYASRGWPVFPVGPDKRPLTEHGFKDATTDEKTISRLWLNHPEAGIGVPVPVGFFVLDVDPRNGGDATLDSLTRQHEPLPPTVRARTGGGGEHLWFKLPASFNGAKLPSKIGDGLDIRAGSKAYVVVPPSPHMSGKSYEWELFADPEEQVVAEAPKWLADLLLTSPSKGFEGPGVPEFSRLEGLTEGQRDETIFKYACDLRRRFTPKPEAKALVLAVARACKPPFPDADALIKLEQAWKYKAGQEEPNKEITSKPGLNMVLAINVNEEKIEWLWGGRIPKRSLTFISGDPGLGKSHICVDLAARLSSGSKWPDSGMAEPGAALFMSSEDGFADVLRPRLRIAGADLRRIGFLTGKSKPNMPEVEFLLTLHEDLAAIESALPDWTNQFGVPIRMFVIDPFLNHLGVQGREQEVRPLLAKLAAFLRRTGMSAVGVRHLNKTAEKTLLYRPGGLMAFTGAARAEYVVGKDPGDPSRRIFAGIKNSLAIETGSLAFQIVGSQEDPSISTITWLGPVNITAEEALAPPPDTSQNKRAETFLLGILGEGQELSSEEILSRASEVKIGRNSVYDAAKSLGVIKRPGSVRGRWSWSLAADMEA